ncbi:MAG: hypothetical protein KF850_28000 [Labilithrix sp.]|nr:hypothetical protein [Labilithrix sp.]
MPSTTVVVACVAGLSLLVVLILLARSRRKAAEAETPRFEPPREIAKRPSKAAPEPTAVSAEPPPAKAEASPKAEPPAAQTPPTPPAETEKPELDGATANADPERTPPSAEVVVDAIAEDAAAAKVAPAAAPPLPRAGSKPGAPRPPMPSYSSINDESVAEEVRRESMTPAPAATTVDDGPDAAPVSDGPAATPATEPTAAPAALAAAPPAAAAAAPAAPQPATKPPAAAPKTPAVGAESARPASEARLAAAKRAAVSEPRVATAPTSEAKAPAAKPAPTSEAKAPAAKPAPTSQAKIGAPKPAVSEPKLPAPAADEHDFSALNDELAGKPKAAATTSAAAMAAKFAPPPNPATADLEKNDPRHAAARRLARVSVSEIKLYHEDEVKAGREAKDLWKRLQQDIALAKQTFEGRVVPEVRERFDYLLDEIVRQLAEGDASKLGPDAPKPKGASTEVATSAPTTPPPAAPPATGNLVDPEAPTRTLHKTLEPADASPTSAAAAPAATPSTRTQAAHAAAPSARTQAAHAATPSTRTQAAHAATPSTRTQAAPAAAPSTRTQAAPAAAPTAPPAKPAEAGKPSGIAARGLPPNPETAELEKNDPRHAAARRLARLSVSEIKLYHEDEVKAGREAKDLWKRMIADIGLATQTYEKRVDKEVRDRFDYVYDEILRQLAEGDSAKLGPDAPKPKAAPADAPAPDAPKPAAAAPVVDEAKPAPAPGPAARYAPPSNPATAELEKSDPRHAAARRLARLSVSEIKLYHEDEVKAGREAKDLWKRLTTDIGLATQTYEKRVDKEVRDRFDYLYDEILRQLAEGDSAKLGPDAPKPKTDA